MVYRFITFLVLFTLIYTPSLSQSYQTTPIKKEENRFIGNVDGVVQSYADPANLIADFDLHIQWWSLMGEPVEYYDFTWQSTEQYSVEVDGKERLMTRTMLTKYPDLLKRFDRITPIDVQIKIEGNAGSGVISNDRFGYEIPSVNIVPSYAGKKGDGIVPGSQHWNEFFTWSATNFNYQKGSKQDRTLLQKNKNKFEDTETLNIVALLKEIKWPLTELKNIVEKYDRYESGAEKPGNSDARELNDLLSDLSQEEISDFKIEYRDGKEGVIAGDGRILIPFKEWDITSFDPKTGFAEVEKNLEVRTRNGSCDKVFRAQIIEVSTVDSSGESILPPKKIAVTFYGYNGTDDDTIQLVLTTYPNETLEEKRARERRQAEARKKREAEQKRCDALNDPIFNAFKKELQAQNIDTSRL